MFVYDDVFVQHEFHFEEDINMLLNIYSQNFQCFHLEKYQIWTHNNPWSQNRPIDWNFAMEKLSLKSSNKTLMVLSNLQKLFIVCL
jgi:hypothetical protein